MSEGTGPPGPEWFEEMAHNSGVIFYALRIQPDVAFEYLGSALPTRLGVPVADGTVDSLDIDRFKTVNDSFGHQAGDHVLIEVAGRLRRSLRGNDMVARWGGEEFVVLLRDCALPDALTLAEGIRAEIAEVPFGALGRLTVSIGVAEIQADEDLGSWLERADQALYRAKRAGRNEVAAAEAN